MIKLASDLNDRDLVRLQRERKNTAKVLNCNSSCTPFENTRQMKTHEKRKENGKKKENDADRRHCGLDVSIHISFREQSRRVQLL